MIGRFTLDEDLPDAPSANPNTLLTIELVPSSSWGDNLRSRLTKAQWDKIRKHSYQLANYQCEVCGGSGKNQGYNWPVECHEVWHYDDINHVQKLTKLISLCPRCHMAKHIGRAQLDGKEGLVIAHMQKVNGWTHAQVQDHIRDSFRVWQERSRHPWELDIKALYEYGVISI